jgi:hypothetical protein
MSKYQIPYGAHDVDSNGPLYLRCDKGNPGELYHTIEFMSSVQYVFLMQRFGDKMRILFLGISAAISFPLAFCRCRVLEKARINKGKDIRKRTSLIINNDMPIDIGTDVITS